MANISQKISLDLLANIKANPIGFEQTIARFKEFIKLLGNSNVPADRLQGVFNTIKNSLKNMQAGKLDLSNWEASISSLRQQILNLSTALKEVRGMASKAGVDKSKISAATAPLSTMAMSAHGKLTQQSRIAQGAVESKLYQGYIDKQYADYISKQAKESASYYALQKKKAVEDEQYKQYINKQAKESATYYASLSAQKQKQT